MSIPLTINGAVFEYPQNFDEDWGVAGTGWAQAVTAGALYLSGGNFPLTATVDFGASFGVKVLSITSKASNPSTAGFLRLAVDESVGFRNNANSADLLLAVDASDMLTFNGSVLGLTALAQNDIYVGDASNQPAAVAMSGDATIVSTGVITIANSAITDAKVSASAAITLSKLAPLTASRAVVSDGSGVIVAATTTATEIGYVNGVTSSIQAQLNALKQVPSGAMLDFAGMAAPTGWLLCDGSAISRTTFADLFAAIGVTWGPGNGSSTFNIPNMTRRVGMGSGGSGTAIIENTVGSVGGAETHSLTVPEMPGHSHTASSAVTDPGHFHTISQSTGASGTGGNALLTSAGANNVNTNSKTTGITVATTTTNTGGGLAFNIVQPAAIVLKIIKI